MHVEEGEKEIKEEREHQVEWRSHMVIGEAREWKRGGESGNRTTKDAGMLQGNFLGCYYFSSTLGAYYISF